MLAEYLAWRFVDGITKTRYHGRSQNEAPIWRGNDKGGKRGH